MSGTLSKTLSRVTSRVNRQSGFQSDACHHDMRSRSTTLPPVPTRYALAIILVMLPAVSHAADVAVGVRAGTTGLGPEVAFALADTVDVRAVTGWYSYDLTYDKTGIRYDGTVELRNAIALLDWHPGGSAFRVSVGGGWNDDQLKVSAPLRELVRRERPDLLPLVPEGIGTLRGSAQGDTLAPYAGIGWGRPFGDGSWSTSLDLGALYLGKPEVDLAVDSPLLTGLPASVQQAVRLVAADEERRLERELDDYRYLPVVSLGVTFRF